MHKSHQPYHHFASPLAFLLSLTIITASLTWPNGRSASRAAGRNAAETAPNFIDDATFFVRRHYIDFLMREPDSAGLQFWTNEITSCGNDAQCREVKRINVSAAFFLSIEFQETGYLVYRFYKAAFGDIPAKPIPVTRGEFLPDTVQIGRGVRVGIGNWQQQLEQNKVAFATEFVTRPRFTSKYPSTMSAAQFVDTLNTNTGGALTQTERNNLVNALVNNQMTRAQVLRAVAEDQTFRDSQFNKAFVLMQYFGYLMREPDASPDTNFDGFNFWLNKLNQFNGNFINAEMVKAFISSIEYRDRFAQPQLSAFSNPSDVLLLRAKTARGEVLDYFGEKDALGHSTAVHSVRVMNRDGQVTNVSLDSQSRPSRIQAFNGVVLDITWLSKTNIVVSALSADGSVQVNIPVDLATDTTTSAVSTSQILKSSNMAKAPALRKTRSRAGAAVGLVVTPLNKVQQLPPVQAAAAGTSLVNVKRCDAAVDNASVGMTVIPSNPANTYTVPATFISSGQYSVSIPTQPSPGQDVENACQSISEILGVGCDGLSALPPGAEALICARIGLAASGFGPEVGGPVFAACEVGFAGARRYCDTVGWSPVPGSPSILDALCGHISELVDRFAAGELRLIPVVSVPGVGVINTGSGATAPSSGPFPTFNVNAGSKVEIVSFVTNPADPAPFQSYVATAQIHCAPADTQVTISIVGTDGFTSSSNAIIQGDANATLFVPGAEEGVVDTVTVRVSNGPTRQIVLVF